MLSGVSKSKSFIVSVRPGRRNDAGPLGEFVMKAWRESGPDALGFTGATDEAVKEIASEEFLTRLLSSPNAKIVVAEGEGMRILGFASLRKGEERKVELSGVVVLRDASGKGVGTRLVRKACDMARKQGFREMIVKTEVFNRRAVDFYKRNGFTESGKGTEKVGRTKVPIQILERRL